MAVVIGLCFAFAGGVAALAGFTARQRVLRLRRSGEPAWAMVVLAPAGPDEPAGRSARRNLIQYPLADGRVIEQICPRPIRKAAAPTVGQKVPVWYDRADPTDVLINGWDGRYADRAFLAAGAFFILVGLGIALGR
jgi:Protein of unknown function (DUF3592)